MPVVHKSHKSIYKLYRGHTVNWIGLLSNTEMGVLQISWMILYHRHWTIQFSDEAASKVINVYSVASRAVCWLTFKVYLNLSTFIALLSINMLCHIIFILVYFNNLQQFCCLIISNIFIAYSGHGSTTIWCP